MYAVILPLMYFFVTETFFILKLRETEVIFDKVSLNVYEIILPDPNKTTRDRLRIFSGRVTQNASFWHMSVKPISVITFPAVIYSALTYTVYAAGLPLIALLQDTVFSAPP